MAPHKPLDYEPFDAVAASDQISALENGSLDPAHKLAIVQLDAPNCNGICKNTTRHPDCLCGLIPAPGSWKKKGLWRRDLISSIGQDPTSREREVMGTGFICP